MTRNAKMNIFVAVFIFGALTAFAESKFTTCKRDYNKIGCFKQSVAEKVMHTELVNDRDATSGAFQGHSIDWNRFKDSLHSLACRCSEKAKEKGFTYFSIRFYGECHGGNDKKQFHNLVRSEGAESENCVGHTYESCDHESDIECAGKGYADYIYEITDNGAGSKNVDGGYSKWSTWSKCSASCGKGFQVRERTCTNPLPEGEGKSCEHLGPSTEKRDCTIKSCPVDGKFTTWSKFISCSKSCGGGIQTRTRTCTNPKPAHGGKNCVGPTTHTRSCNTQHCPVHGGYSMWSSFSECSKPCGGGTKTRKRSCTNPRPAYGGNDCEGPSTQTVKCNTQACPVNGRFTTWSKFTSCSKSCGGGTQTRTRTCTNPRPAYGGKNCVGSTTHTQRCNIQHCPVNGRFTSWSRFTSCSRSCGGGTQTRTRTCTNPRPAYGGKNCVGSSTHTQRCNTQHCPAPAKIFRICEHRHGGMLKCPIGKAIEVVSANYGRRSRHYCGFASHFKTNCGSSVSTRKVRERCQNQNSCYLLASNGIFGDPCVGTVKYLEVYYRCVSPASKLVRVCEHHPGIQLACPVGTVIKVTSANYGRLSTRICMFGDYSKTNCRATSSLGLVGSQCNNKRSCHVLASNGIFGDPCPRIVKYLEVTYQCIPVPTQLRLVCEHKHGQAISCPFGYEINIRGANYGRLTHAYCQSNNYRSWSCKAGNSLSRVRQECQGKRNCYVLASNGIFGDPCGGIVKYLEIRYQCVPVPEKQRVACEHKGATTITCPRYQKIHVKYANYGRLSIGYCKFGSHHRWNCKSGYSLAKSNQFCENKQQCSILPANSIFGDPCYGIVKYLDFQYQCVSPYERHVIWCEHTSGGRIACPRGQRIHIRYANYGRHSLSYCQSGKHHRWNCGAKSSLSKVRSICENKESCGLIATNHWFGDPCWGIVKYLEVKYICI